MARDLKLEFLLKAVDRVTKPIKAMTEQSSGLVKKLQATKDQVKELNATQRKVDGFRKLTGDMQGTAKQLDAAQGKVRDLRKAMEKSGTATDAWGRKYNAAVAASKKLSDKLTEQRRELGRAGAALKEAGIDTRDLTSHENILKERIDATNKSIDAQKEKLKRLGEQQRRMDTFKGAAADVDTAAGKVGAQGRRLAGQAAVAGAAGGYLFKTQFLDRAAEFEKFNTILKTVTGSEKKAAEAMSWVSDFAAKTPYELAEVLESFTRLKAYGIDPMANGLLRTLGDTASAMGKDVMQAVEAIADAVTGENERLKEFGIKGSKDGGEIVYEYTNAAGETMTKSVEAGNRKLIQSTLQAIWNEKYSGVMDEQSRTWGGMVSNLSDQWARFTNMVMGAGLFDRMKERLSALLDTIDKMAANGQLAAWAQKTGEGMLRFFDGVWKAGTAIAEVTSQIAEAVGGWKNFTYILVALKLAPLVLSLIGLGSALFSATGALFAVIKGSAAFTAVVPMVVTAIKAIGVAFWALAANPITLIIAGIVAALVALGAMAYLIYKNWEPIKAFFGQTWGEIYTQVAAFIGKISKILINWNPLGLLYRAITSGLALLGVEIPEKFKTLGGAIVDGLIGGLLAKFPSVSETLIGLANKAQGVFEKMLGINSPSRVFAGLGDDTMAGLQVGLERSQSGPLNSVMKAGKAMAGAGAIALGAGSAMPAMAVDSRPPLAAASNTSAAPVYHIEINVQSQPGMDEGHLARLVAQELQKATQQRAASRRSALYDTD